MPTIKTPSSTTAKTANASKPKEAKAKNSGTKRKVLYKQITIEPKHGKDPLTVEDAKMLLGWKEEPSAGKFNNNHIPEIKRLIGKQVQLTNNVSNRPIYVANMKTLMQEIARNRWKFNGEPIIISRTGLVLNGQHTLISLVCLAELYHAEPDNYPELTGTPSIEKLVVLGVSDDDDVVNTMDTCKPRSLADVVYRSHYFADMSSSDQRKLSKIMESAIRQLWFHSGNHNAYAPKALTSAEAIAYIEQHPKLVEAVSHIYTENEEGKIGKVISPGWAAAMMYLMATMESDPEKYYTSEQQDHTLLNFDRWEHANSFFVELAAGAKIMQPIRDCLATLLTTDDASRSARWALLCNAWEYYVQDEPFTAEDIMVEFTVEDGVQHLMDSPALGGIDLGDKDTGDGLQFATPEDTDVKEVQKRTQETRSKKEPKPDKDVFQKTKGEWNKGDRCWVHPEENAVDEEPYFAEITLQPFACEDGKQMCEVTEPDGTWSTLTSNLSLSKHAIINK